MGDGKAIESLPNLRKMTRQELEKFITYCDTERGLQEAILGRAKEGDDVADVVARIKELGRWKNEAQKERARRPEEEGPRRLLSLEELEAEAAKEIEWLVPGLRLPVGGSCLIAGPPGIGKSFLALHTAICVASGDDFLQHYPTMPGSVVYVDEENSATALNVRQAMLRNSNGLHLERLCLWVAVKQGFLLDEKDALDELIALLKPLEPELLILDPLIRLHRADENSAQQMGIVTKNLSRIQRQVGCAIILVQHQRKEGSARRKRDVVRGSSELTAWPDSVVTLGRNRHHQEAYILKSRYSEDGQVIVYEQFIDGDVAVFEFLREEEADAPNEEKAKRVIAELFADGRVWTRRELFAETKPMGVGQKTTLVALQRLEHEDHLITSWRRGLGGPYHYQRRDVALEEAELSHSEA